MNMKCGGEENQTPMPAFHTHNFYLAVVLTCSYASPSTPHWQPSIPLMELQLPPFSKETGRLECTPTWHSTCYLSISCFPVAIIYLIAPAFLLQWHVCINGLSLDWTTSRYRAAKSAGTKYSYGAATIEHTDPPFISEALGSLGAL